MTKRIKLIENICLYIKNIFFVIVWFVFILSFLYALKSIIGIDIFKYSHIEDFLGALISIIIK